MEKFIKTEFIKEKKSANSNLIKIVPLIFVVFTCFVVLFMVPPTNGQSYLLAAAFNWYPLLILPIVLSLLVVNIFNKEKIYHKNLYRSLGINQEEMIWAKAMVILTHLLVILLDSAFLLYLLGHFLLGDPISLGESLKASLVLFIGSLPIVGLSFIFISLFNKGFIVILINFILSLIGPILAVKDIWILFPHAYNLRMLASAVGIHPNGTFLQEGSALLDRISLYIGSILSIAILILAVGLACKISKGKRND